MRKPNSSGINVFEDLLNHCVALLLQSALLAAVKKLEIRPFSLVEEQYMRRMVSLNIVDTFKTNTVFY